MSFEINITKQCNKCLKFKELINFRKWRNSCKQCGIVDSNNWKRNNPDQRKQTRKKHYNNNKDQYKNVILKCLYKISLDDYNNLLIKQNELCAICNKKESSISKSSGLIKKLSVDHNHETKKVRALLCEKCNRGLGYFCDDIEILDKASEYLKYHGEKKR